ncbi:MAG: InlB B-repeat-containing protein [Nitrososphaerota archaeon]|jgi:uncharacterized repeat protein (TIGR02543 family)|nr:InlB B-repeat-containing protein [Nitrososphaerota archaeon]
MNVNKTLKKTTMTLIAVCMIAGAVFVIPAAIAADQEWIPTSIEPISSPLETGNSTTPSEQPANGCSACGTNAGNCPNCTEKPVNESSTDVMGEVTYDANGGQGAGQTLHLQARDLVYGNQHVVLSPDQVNVSANAGYTFAGWNTERDGSGLIGGVPNNFIPNIHTFIPTNVTLYAQWTPQVVNATALANVTKGSGNRNILNVNVLEMLADGTNHTLSQSFDLKGVGASNTYSVGSYQVFVSTDKNARISACYIV